MSTSTNQRTFERIPFSQRVKVVSTGRMVAYTLAINIGMGGVLLSSASAPRLPIGSQCQVAIPSGEGSPRLVADGIVIRSDLAGTAVQFLKTIESNNFDSIFQPTLHASYKAIRASYKAYFQVSRNQELAGCEDLLGVSKHAFRTTFYISFVSCISLAILPVWLFRSSLPAFPNWTKVVLCFGYGTIWLAFIQPAIDLAVFRFLRQHPSSG